MPLRDLILNNFRWKLTALILAVTVWFIIYRAAPGDLLTISDWGKDERRVQVPVQILRAPEDARTFHLKPQMVEVRMRGDATVLKTLGENGITAYVNLTEVQNVDQPAKVYVHAPDGIDVLGVVPIGVNLERVTSADSD